MDLKKLTETIIQTQILEAFKSHPEHIDALVRAVLERPVDEHGSKPRYSHDKSMPYLEWLARETLEGVVRDTVVTWVTENAEHIKGEVVKALESAELFSEVTKAVTQSMTRDYAVKVEVTSRKQED